MKIILEEKDLNFIENLNKDLDDGIENLPLFINKKDQRYFFEFTCTDIARANLFAFLLMCQNREDSKQFMETFGIEVECINYCTSDHRLSTLKSYLQDFIVKLDTIS